MSLVLVSFFFSARLRVIYCRYLFIVWRNFDMLNLCVWYELERRCTWCYQGSFARCQLKLGRCYRLWSLKNKIKKKNKWTFEKKTKKTNFSVKKKNRDKTGLWGGRKKEEGTELWRRNNEHRHSLGCQFR